MGAFARVRDFLAPVVLAFGLLAFAPHAHSGDPPVLNQHLPTLQSLVAHGQQSSGVQAATAATEPICDIFANGYDEPGATVCAGCFDATVDFDETDVDCGGTFCKACADGMQCLASSDCSSSVCNASTHLCAPATCVDAVKDGNETDVDCGGSCPACPTGLQCIANADCQSGRCANNVCTELLFISQVQSRGEAGAADEFVELYNPSSVAVVFDSNWTLTARTTVATSYSSHIVGGGQTIPSHGHILYAGTSYNASTMADASLLAGIADASSLVLQHNGSVVDALCFGYDVASLSTFTAPGSTYTCAGTPIVNPHDNSNATNVDASLERKPGGTGGNMTNAGDNAMDFFANPTPDPHDLGSDPTP